MNALVTIHPSQFPDRVRLDLLESLRTRRVNHKFHYESHKQAQKWLRVREAWAPSRRDASCAACYDLAFAAAAGAWPAGVAHVVGLGCGGGEKDARLLRELAGAGRELAYTPVDVSVALTLVARQAALEIVAPERCFAFVCDFQAGPELARELEAQAPGTARLFTFFGMLPNFSPGAVLPWLATLVRPDDFLLLSANLAPGDDYAAGVRAILPQYDNDLTRDWLMTFLLDLGVEPGDGSVRFGIEPVPGDPELRQVAAWFRFDRPRGLRVYEDCFDFLPGNEVRLFFSIRHTPETVRETARRVGLTIAGEWRTPEEAVYLLKHGGGVL